MTTEQPEVPENAWGETPEDEDPDDGYSVPEAERKDDDYEEGSYSLGTTGDDLPAANAERAAYERSLQDEGIGEEEE